MFQRYQALKQHFNTDYDFFKFNGKTRCKVSTFENHRDKFRFAKLAKRDDYDLFLLANIVKDPGQWIGNLSEDVYLDWCKRIQSLGYTFRHELEHLSSDFNSNFVSVKGHHPPLLSMYLSGKVNLETIMILDDILDFCKTWDKMIDETYIWPTISMKIRKYRPFLKYNKAKMRTILLEIIGGSGT